MVQEAPLAYGLRWVMLRTFPIKLVYTVYDDPLLSWLRCSMRVAVQATGWKG